MPTPPSLTPTNRITARIPQQIHHTLEHAAGLVGATLNQFLIQAALKEAETVLKTTESMHQIILSAEDYQHMWHLIENPPPPNNKLKQAFLKSQELLNVSN
jgi:uncharacterized protein (DUF1778 family)